ncbi:MAG: GGDEF domain-containing protein [Nitrospinota bacterium]
MEAKSGNTFHEDPRILVSHIIGKINTELAFIFENVHSRDEISDPIQSNLERYSQALRSSPNETVIKEVISSLMADINKLQEKNAALNRDVKKSIDSVRKIEMELEVAQKEAMFDGLTNLYNRKAFERRMVEVFDEFNRYGNKFCLAFIDLDNFKKVNDTLGHTIGDLVLQEVGKQIQKNLRTSDIGCRYGGEEFITIFSNTSLQGGSCAAERLRESIEKAPVLREGGEPIHVTVSIGVCQARKGMEVAQLIKRADQAMYVAKKGTKNSVKTEEDL